jgi:hypothetical protein
MDREKNWVFSRICGSIKHDRFAAKEFVRISVIGIRKGIYLIGSSAEFVGR